MSAVTQFAPSPLAPFQFQATLDGVAYVCTVTWALFGARWWLTIRDQNGVAVVAQPLTASPDAGRQISLTGGYFTSTMIFLESQQTFVVTP